MNSIVERINQYGGILALFITIVTMISALTGFILIESGKVYGPNEAKVDITEIKMAVRKDIANEIKEVRSETYEKLDQIHDKVTEIDVKLSSDYMPRPEIQMRMRQQNDDLMKRIDKQSDYIGTQFGRLYGLVERLQYRDFNGGRPMPPMPQMEKDAIIGY